MNQVLRLRLDNAVYAVRQRVDNMDSKDTAWRVTITTPIQLKMTNMVFITSKNAVKILTLRP